MPPGRGCVNSIRAPCGAVGIDVAAGAGCSCCRSRRAAGLAVILVAVFAGFAGRPTVDLGPFVLPMYASSGVFAYLCALLFVWITLRRDPRASSTLRWLSVLLPVGAAPSVGAGMAIAWWRNFNPTPTVLAVVVGVVIVVHGTTACLARHKAVTGTRPETI